MQELTVKDLRIALIGVPDDLPVRLSSDRTLKGFRNR